MKSFYRERKNAYFHPKSVDIIKVATININISIELNVWMYGKAVTIW